VLIVRRQDGDGCAKIVSRLEDVAPALTRDHLKVHRFSGSCQSLDLGDRYQVKRIVVKQGGWLSPQLHHHRRALGCSPRQRACHDRRQGANGHENESVYMPIGARHRLEKSQQDRSSSLRCRPAATSARMTSNGSRTIIAAPDFEVYCDVRCNLRRHDRRGLQSTR
jgi:hypothetical protein